MEQNVVVGLFEVESEGFQAITELKQDPGTEKSFMTQAALFKKENGSVKILEAFDTGEDTLDDMAIGGIIGSLVGILGGPVGVLLGGSYGALVGSVVDSADAVDNASIIEKIAMKMDDGDVAIVGLASEEDESVLDEKLGKFKTTIIRFDAAVVAVEVEEAREMADELARQARKELRDEKKEARKQKIEAKKAEISADFDNFKAKLKKD